MFSSLRLIQKTNKSLQVLVYMYNNVNVSIRNYPIGVFQNFKMENIYPCLFMEDSRTIGAFEYNIIIEPCFVMSFLVHLETSCAWKISPAQCAQLHDHFIPVKKYMNKCVLHSTYCWLYPNMFILCSKNGHFCI